MLVGVIEAASVDEARVLLLADEARVRDSDAIRARAHHATAVGVAHGDGPTAPLPGGGAAHVVAQVRAHDHRGAAAVLGTAQPTEMVTADHALRHTDEAEAEADLPH